MGLRPACKYFLFISANAAQEKEKSEKSSAGADVSKSAAHTVEVHPRLCLKIHCLNVFYTAQIALIRIIVSKLTVL